MKINTERRSDVHPHLTPAELDQLLDNDAVGTDARAGDALGAAADHLDRCEMCQSRLTALAAGAGMWSDIQSYLSGDSEPRWEPDTSQVETSAVEAQREREVVHDVLAKILGTPNHPEMLGRLGRYDIERVIGSGGMGIVLKAHDGELNRPIAIKLLAPQLAHVGAARERFAREGRAAAAVVHEHVVAIHNVESDGPVPFLVMQYVPGRSLQARVDEDGPLGVEEILRIGEQAASGLAAAHRQGLVHRDVKPANILLENTVERAVLTDFGLARAIDDASLTQTGILAGTPHYMSPEQSMGGPIDHRSDLFGLGAVLYFMATGHPPFRGASALGVLHRICREEHRPVWQVNAEIPDELSDAIDRLLEKKPARRFASAEEVQQELAVLLNRAQSEGLGRRRFRGWRVKRLRRKLAAGAAVLAVTAAIVFGVSWWVRPVTRPLEPVDPQALAASAAAESRANAEFLAELAALSASVPESAGPSFYLQQGGDDWNREMDLLRRELGGLESISGSIAQ